MISRVVGVYFRLLPYASSISIGVGIGEGLRGDDWVRVLGNGVVGGFVGVFYPVSFPLLGYNFLRKG